MSQAIGLAEYTSIPLENSASLDNALLLERLDTLIQKSLGDIKAFAERESRAYEEIRRYVAEWHAKSLFGVADSEEERGLGKVTVGERLAQVRSILIATSKALESLADVTGVHSFLLAVDPHDPQDMGFLGGSLIGREYYRGLRGGGTAGAGSFKVYAQKRVPPTSASQDEVQTQESGISVQLNTVTPVVARSARQVKVDLYDTIRSQLRKVSNIRKAEMKWTNPERLGLYGVRMIGWPPDIPAANPSSLKANQNQRLLDLIEQGELKFEKTAMIGLETLTLPETSQSTPDAAEEDDFSWALDTDAGGTTTTTTTGAAAATKPVQAGSVSSVPLDPTSMPDPTLSNSGNVFPVEGDNSGSRMFSWKKDGDENLLTTAEGGGGSVGFDEYGFQVEPWSTMMSVESPIEPVGRGRKRARSSESGVDS